MSDGFPSLTGGHDDLEEGFWSSFSNVMMVILKIFLLVIVLMALNNRNLLDDLKNSVRAQEAAKQQAQLADLQAKQAAAEAQKASQAAEFQLKANASLEDQLDYLQQRSNSLEMELLQSKAETEQAKSAKVDQESELLRLKSAAREQADSLKLKEDSVAALKLELQDKNTQIQGLSKKVDESEKKLLSLQGDYSELDKKYQKLLRPARSSKNKQVVEVTYTKSGYTIRRPGEAASRAVPRTTLEGELAELKAQYNTDLYVKVIIPDSSGLSYNEAWRFTNDMLSRYDYYQQPDSSKPAE